MAVVTAGVLCSASASEAALHSAPIKSNLGSLRISFKSTGPTGIQTYAMTTPDDGPGTQSLRVLAPTNPAAGVTHNFLLVLPVERGLQHTYGDGIKAMQAADAANKYNLTIIEPTFAVDPWYANDPNDPDRQYESFVVKQLVPWVKAHLKQSGSERIWLIGFSKSGLGAQDLILKYPKLFSVAATWDFPANMHSFSAYKAADVYGTNANFQANYRLTRGFVAKNKAAFTTTPRIWIGGYAYFKKDVTDYDRLLTNVGIKHTLAPFVQLTHSWVTGWVPTALAALATDNAQLAGG
jgi:S-formylglutathione hydrolase FrmB